MNIQEACLNRYPYLSPEDASATNSIAWLNFFK